ncbi:GDSL esterase/lipase WDL1-like isoform X3 [Citrus sinensis]|uniref:GDSL esterase/lipase WDL1-like isoform X3 n=1 Tax=Citrus sinensis TaxID=2711 RepID=UPI0003D7107C|nr:GDSL esterase/lipase WDL1-like isoform X3 [Citrus sinensis]XP_024037686.1 GDSL esterase/lipase CPRD49 isoform X2 [Citrus x clementina]
MVGPERPQFVLFGSSIVQYGFGNEGWGAILADLYARKADILLRGYAGWNSRRAVQVLDRVFPKSLSAKTRIIFLSAPPINKQQIFESHLSTDFAVWGRTNESCRIYSEACLKLCQEMDVKAIDLWTAMQQRDDWLTTCFMDGIHFSSEGSKIVVTEILKVLREADWEPSLHWRSLPTEFDEDSSYYPVAPDGQSTVNVSDTNIYGPWE